MSLSHPPTIIIVHPKEKRSKCTAEPLRGRAGFLLVRYPAASPPVLDDYVRLGIGGERLGPDDRNRGILVLDATWRYARHMERDFEHIPTRGLPDWKTAYPRKSKLFDDPLAGLATIEAIYLAYRILDRATDGLLDAYPMAQEFLRLNGES